MNSQNLNNQNQNPQNLLREGLYNFRDWNVISWNRRYGMDKYKLLGIYLLVFMFFLLLIVSFSSKDIAELNAKHRMEVSKLQQVNEELVNKHEKHIALLQKRFDVEKIQLKMIARAKAKIQRSMSIIPVINLAAFATFEKLDFDDWKIDHPEGTVEEYAHEMYETSQNLYNKEYSKFKEYAGISQKFLEGKYHDFESFSGHLSEDSKKLLAEKYLDLKNNINNALKLKL